MEIKPINKLSEELLKEFGDRKKEGRLDLVYDIDSEKYFPVPRNIEHADFMPQIQANPKALIPVQIRMYREKGKKIITDLLVGASSYEAEYGIRHPQAYLKKAYDQALIFLNNHNDFEISHKARLEIMQKFVERN
ncbi:hypothetical protein KY342_06935 [Candidatus Woesearchaeota archaeon]|nr:hypothetical protein [Candidatus Woesearchaeota archaeon]